MKAAGLIVAAAAALLVAGLAYGGGDSAATATFACPSDPRTQPLGRIYGKNRGSTFCSNGASARVSVGSAKAIIVNFKNGVCWKSRQGLNVGIGTSIVGKRKGSDPPGFWLQDFKPVGFVKDSVDLGKGTVTWGHEVKIRYAANKRSGTWSGTEPTLVNGKLTYIPASGSFTCKRILDAPEQ